VSGKNLVGGMVEVAQGSSSRPPRGRSKVAPAERAIVQGGARDSLGTDQKR